MEHAAPAGEGPARRSSASAWQVAGPRSWRRPITCHPHHPSPPDGLRDGGIRGRDGGGNDHGLDGPAPAGPRGNRPPVSASLGRGAPRTRRRHSIATGSQRSSTRSGTGTRGFGATLGGPIGPVGRVAAGRRGGWPRQLPPNGRLRAGRCRQPLGASFSTSQGVRTVTGVRRPTRAEAGTPWASERAHRVMRWRVLTRPRDRCEPDRLGIADIACSGHAVARHLPGAWLPAH